jgi:hypothetical protein
MEIIPSFLIGFVAFSSCDSCCAWLGLYNLKKKSAFEQSPEEDELLFLETDF